MDDWALSSPFFISLQEFLFCLFETGYLFIYLFIFRFLSSKWKKKKIGFMSAAVLDTIYCFLSKIERLATSDKD